MYAYSGRSALKKSLLVTAVHYERLAALNRRIFTEELAEADVNATHAE